ncbi:oligosaccharide flippase family protein [Alteromonas mediterranea]|uniref:oligosaccharide flippase family protein n=1 Tax=Alteromonas mediterranea TaxID=314275 RepID=UPI0015E86608|nr:oligosaccharide flippase family protein [Alteromonas mediterranea]
MTVTRKVLNSALLAASAKVISKVLGLVSTMLLARILAPEEFGYIAIISIVIYFFDILSHVASEQYVIRRGRVTFEALYTAWTANLLLKLAISILIVLSAPVTSNFFERPELASALSVAALILPLQALRSPAYILLKRQLKFTVLFWSTLIERLFAVPLLVILALVFKSYWAFVITDVTACIFGVVLSYIVAKKKLRFTLSELKEQWQFSKWMIGKNIVGYARSQCDTVIVSKFFSALTLGNFHMARELAMMPAHFLLGPAIEPLLSAFKDDKDRHEALLNNVAFSIVVVLIVSVPLCAFFWVFAEQIILVLLGPGWELANELLPVLAFLFLYWTLMQVIETALIAQGRVQLVFAFDCISLLFIVVSLLSVLSYSDSVFDVAWIRVLLGVITCMTITLVMFKENTRHLYPVLTICCGMVGAVLVWKEITSIIMSLYFLEINETILLILFPLLAAIALIIVVACSLILLMRLTNNYHLLRLYKIIENAVSRKLTA